MIPTQRAAMFAKMAGRGVRRVGRAMKNNKALVALGAWSAGTGAAAAVLKHRQKKRLEDMRRFEEKAGMPLNDFVHQAAMNAPPHDFILIGRRRVKQKVRRA